MTLWPVADRLEQRDGDGRIVADPMSPGRGGGADGENHRAERDPQEQADVVRPAVGAALSRCGLCLGPP